MCTGFVGVSLTWQSRIVAKKVPLPWEYLKKPIFALRFLSVRFIWSILRIFRNVYEIALRFPSGFSSANKRHGKETRNRWFSPIFFPRRILPDPRFYRNIASYLFMEHMVDRRQPITVAPYGKSSFANLTFPITIDFSTGYRLACFKTNSPWQPEKGLTFPIRPPYLIIKNQQLTDCVQMQTSLFWYRWRVHLLKKAVSR